MASTTVVQGKDDRKVEIYEDRISLYLDQYIQEHQIEDMRKEPQSRWNAALLYIYKYMFKDNNYLKSDNYTTGNLINNNSSNCNSYDIDRVNNVCDIYINLCYEYDKEISILGFCKLTGITQETIFTWANSSNNNNRFNYSSSEIYKKLNQEREETLSNRLYSNRGNPVGILGILNRHYGWNMGQPRGQQEQKTQSLDDIARRYGISQDDKQDAPQITAQEEPPKADF